MSLHSFIVVYVGRSKMNIFEEKIASVLFNYVQFIEKIALSAVIRCQLMRFS